MAIRHITAYDEFVDFVTSSPTLEDVTSFRLSDMTEHHIRELLDKNRNQMLTADEQIELDEYIRVEHIIRMAKIRAYEKLDAHDVHP
jgi:hypothetical protein